MCVSRLHSTAPGRLGLGTSKAMRAVAPMTRRSTLIPTRCTTMDRVTMMSWAARTWKHAITTLKPPWTMDRAWLWTSVASVAVMAFLQEHVTVMATSWTNAVCVVGQVRFMSAVARTFLKGSAIATATCSTSVENASKRGRVEIVMAAPMRWRATTMWMPCWTTALAITAAVLAKRKRLCHSHCMWRRRLRCCQA